MDMLDSPFWRTAFFLLWAGNLAAAAYALLLIFSPASASRLDAVPSLAYRTVVAVAGRWWRAERFIYRHHRLFGSLLFGGAVFVLHAFLLRRTRDKLALHVPADLRYLFDAAIAFIVIVGVLGTLLGALVFMKPSLLREIEAAANQRMRMSESVPVLFREYVFMDSAVAKWKKTAGASLFSCCMYVLFFLGEIIFAGV